MNSGDNSYKAAALITTMFGAELIPTYFSPAVSLVDQGSTDGQIAQLVIDLGLLDTSSNETFFSEIYQNVLGVELIADSGVVRESVRQRAAFACRVGSDWVQCVNH